MSDNNGFISDIGQSPAVNDKQIHKKELKPYEVTKFTLSSDISGLVVADTPQIMCQWEECSTVCSNVSVLTHHLKSEHIALKQEIYSCLWKGCPRYSTPQSSRALLLSHMKCHTGEKPFPCPHCDQTFSRSTSLQKHIKSHHEESQILEMIQYDNTKKQKRKSAGNPSFNAPRTLDVPEEHILKVAQVLSKDNIPVFVKDNYNELHVYFHSPDIQDQALSKDSRLSRSEKSLLARYYVEYIENRDLLFEFGELQNQQLALEREIDSLRQMIWPCNK